MVVLRVEVGICRAWAWPLNDWQISGIYRYQTGAPYNVAFSIPGLSGYGVTDTQPNEGGRIVVVSSRSFEAKVNTGKREVEKTKTLRRRMAVTCWRRPL